MSSQETPQTPPVVTAQQAAASRLSVEEVEAMIAKYKKKYEQIMEEQKVLTDSIKERQKLTQEFNQRTEKLKQNVDEDQHHYQQKLQAEKATVNVLLQEEDELKKQIEEAEAALEEEEARIKYLEEQADVFSSAPERKVYFGGKTVEADAPIFEMESQIVYPMLGGTALITFEEEDVASHVLELKEHKVELATDCRITVEAEPVHLLLPGAVEISTEVCPRRILISNLPKMDEDTLLDKLVIHFARTKNGGGEVEGCELRNDSWTVVLTFAEENFAKGLAETMHHDVLLKKTKHRVKVSPFINGDITNLKTQMSMCPRTVLLKGIPDVMEREILQDLLEIHFQKDSNGGGEIEALLYNPLGQNITALFEGTSQQDEDD